MARFHGVRGVLAGVWLCVLGVAACSSAPSSVVATAAPKPPSNGLRVVVSETANNVCVADAGCAGEPKGSLKIEPLQPNIRRVVAEALVAAGFEVVSMDAERDVVAGVEWRGTDTIALGLRDSRGRLIDQASYSRSLEPCRNLADLTWDTCWAANFDHLKQAFIRPFQSSKALQDFVHKRRGGSDAVSASTATTSGALGPSREPARGVLPPASGDRLNDLQVQETVARYREELQRTCWQPALEAREPTAPSSARVSTTVSIDALGAVQDVKTGGDPLGYARLASCIADQVKRWRFPPAKGATTASIPFVFAGD